jgi:hypothetical protein
MLRSIRVKLKPCPFCGGAARVHRYPGERGFVVGCVHRFNGDPNMCPIAPEAMMFISAKAAADAWNTRRRTMIRRFMLMLRSTDAAN